MFIKGIVIAVSAWVLSIAQSVDPVSSLQDSAPAAPTVDAVRGRALYQKNCEICHGKQGDGLGPVVRFLEPRPRDFTKGTYKLRTTPTGTLPTDQDLFRTISRGLAGTAMTGFSGLTVEERWQLVFYIKAFTKRFAENSLPVPLALAPKAPEIAESALARGRQIYNNLECAKCHGADGRGNGPSAYSLKDSQDRPIFPFDMTRGRKMKAGSRVEDIFRVLMTGLDGTPMPSYQESLSEEEAWILSYYIKSLFVDE